jgi:hypothetical protein
LWVIELSSQGSREARQPFYEAGSCQEEFGVGLVHPSIRVSTQLAVANRRCGLIQRCDESHSGLRVFLSGLPRVGSSSQSVSELALAPLELTSTCCQRLLCPWSSPRDYLIGQLICGCQSQGLLSRNMAQHRTNNFRPTATIAIFLRAFLPPPLRR